MTRVLSRPCMGRTEGTALGFSKAPVLPLGFSPPTTVSLGIWRPGGRREAVSPSVPGPRGQPPALQDRAPPRLAVSESMTRRCVLGQITPPSPGTRTQ